MDIKKKVSDYYTDKIKRYGKSSWGVDWNSKESQFLRFKQLCKILPDYKEETFSILDYGCGYGALVEFLLPLYSNFNYIGYDISEEMLNVAKASYNQTNIQFINDDNNLQPCDYLVASGLFNVKLDVPLSTWEDYIYQTLLNFDRLSIKAFSFNLLTSYSDKEFIKDYLYYGDPCKYFDFCKKNLSKNVALLHDYGLYEFTILIKK